MYAYIRAGLLSWRMPNPLIGRGFKQHYIFYHQIQKKKIMFQSLPPTFTKVKPQQHRKLSLVRGGEQRTSSVLPYRLIPSNRLLNEDKGIQKQVLKVNKQAIKALNQRKISLERENMQKSEEKEINRIIEKNRTKIHNQLQHYFLQGRTNAANYKYLLQLHQGVDYSLRHLKEPSSKFLKSKSRMLKESHQNHQKLLFLDLDQTLIYSDKSQGELGSNSITFNVVIRPFTFSFLEVLSQYYEIYVFTSAVKSYAEAIIQRLNKQHEYITDFLCRDSCLETKKGHRIKDLRIVQNRELKDIVIVDNLVQSFGFQLDNGIPIFPYSGENDDAELLNLLPFLVSLSKEEDVRPSIRYRYQLQSLLSVSKDDLHYYFKSGPM